MLEFSWNQGNITGTTCCSLCTSDFRFFPMGNSQNKGKGTNKRRRLNANGAVIQSCAVNVERDLAYSGKHLANLSVLDKVLHCAIKTKGASERQLSGAFLWYLCNPTQTQLDALSENEDWSNRYYQQVKDEEDNAIVRKVKKLSEGTTDVRICRNNITLTVGDEEIWSGLNKSDKKRIEMTMASTFDLSNTAKGLTAGIYRIDFYMQSGKIDSENFYNQSKFPVPSKTIHFEVK